MRSDGCLEEAALQELAAGIAPAEVLEQNTQHIAHCDRCAKVLKRYTSIFSEELTAEEQALVSQLKTSKPQVQRAMARKLMRSNTWMGSFQRLIWKLRRSF
jgi:hypothetical protein